MVKKTKIEASLEPELSLGLVIWEGAPSKEKGKTVRSEPERSAAQQDRFDGGGEKPGFFRGVAERAEFGVGRAWMSLTHDAARMRELKEFVGQVPPAEWFQSFCSDKPAERVSAYWRFRDADVGHVFVAPWGPLFERPVKEGQTRPLIRFRMILSRVFGDRTLDSMWHAAQRMELRLDPEKSKRRYQAYVLRDSFTSVSSVSGSEHEKEAGYVHGAVLMNYRMIKSIRTCLDDESVRRRLNLVPRDLYEEFLPKKTLSRMSLELDLANETSAPGPSLYQMFQKTVSNQANPAEAKEPIWLRSVAWIRHLTHERTWSERSVNTDIAMEEVYFDAEE